MSEKEEIMKDLENAEDTVKKINEKYIDPEKNHEVILITIAENSDEEPRVEKQADGKVRVYIKESARRSGQVGGFWPFNFYKKVPVDLGDIETVTAQLKVLQADADRAYKLGFFDKKLYKKFTSRISYSIKHIQKPEQFNEIAKIIEDFKKSLAARKTLVKDTGEYQTLLAKLDSLNLRIETAYKYKVIDPKIGRAYQSRIAALRKAIKAKKPGVDRDFTTLEADVLKSIEARKESQDFAEGIKKFGEAKTISDAGTAGLQATFIAIYNVFVGIANDFKNTGKFSRIFLLIGFFTILVSALLSYKFLDLFLFDYAATKLRTNPLNGEAVDFKVAQASTGFSRSNMYPYKIFLILPLVILGCAALVFLFGYFFSETTTGSMTGIYAILIVYGLMVLFWNYVFFYMGNYMLSLVKMRIVDFNTIALSRLYAVPAVLSLYTKVQPNTFQVMDTIREGTRKLPGTITAQELAKFLYTTNLYLHYQKIGIRNTAILDALGIFNPQSALLRGVFNPADYFFRKSTYVEDYTDNILAIYKRMKAAAAAEGATEGSDEPIPDKIQNDASIMVADWMADTNNRANTFYAEDAVKPFLIMAILIFIVNTLPFLILLWIFRKPEVRDALFAVIGKIAAATGATSAPARPI